MSDAKFLNTLGARIKELREKKDIKQTELAIRCRFDKASLSRIESGKSNITVLTLKKIGNALDTDIAAFFKK